MATQANDKPTIKEIAAMPFPASVEAMRRHYNKDWGKPVPDDGVLQTFKVTVGYSYRVDDAVTYTVEAFSEEEAEDKAQDCFDEDRTIEDDAEIDDVFAEKVAA